MSNFSELRLCENPMPDSVTEVPPWAQLYPDAGRVFGGSAADRAQAAQHLMPLLGLDLSAFYPSWQGQLTVVGTVEPYDGTLGWGGDAHFNDWVSENWLAFRLDDDNRMHFLGDWRFFALNRMPRDGEAIHTLGDLRDSYEPEELKALPAELLAGDRFSDYQYECIRHAVQFQNYRSKREQGLRRGGLYPHEAWAAEADEAEDPEAYLAWLNEPKVWAWDMGGSCSTDLTAFHAASRSRVANHRTPPDSRDDQYPITPDGRAARYLGNISTGNFGVMHDAETQVFFEPVSRTVWQHFSWT